MARGSQVNLRKVDSISPQFSECDRNAASVHFCKSSVSQLGFKIFFVWIWHIPQDVYF